MLQGALKYKWDFLICCVGGEPFYQTDPYDHNANCHHILRGSETPKMFYSLFCNYSFLCDPFRLAQCWRSSLSASLRREFWNMTAITNALSTAATDSSQGYAAQSCSPQQASGTPTSSINSKIMLATSGLP